MAKTVEEARKGYKKGNSFELPEMRWWSIGDLNS